MLTPKRVKYRKQHRPSLKGKAHKGNTVTYGEFGLQALEAAWITNRQIEAARIAINRYIKRGGKLWIKIFPGPSALLPNQLKPVWVKVKDLLSHWVAVVKPGRVMFELSGCRVKK